MQMAFTSGSSYNGDGALYVESLRRLLMGLDERTGAHQYFSSSILAAETVRALDLDQDNVETNDLRTDVFMSSHTSFKQHPSLMAGDGRYPLAHTPSWMMQDLDDFCIRSSGRTLNASRIWLRTPGGVRSSHLSTLASPSSLLSRRSDLSEVKHSLCYEDCRNRETKELESAFLNNDVVSHSYMGSFPILMPFIFVCRGKDLFRCTGSNENLVNGRPLQIATGQSQGMMAIFAKDKLFCERKVDHDVQGYSKWALQCGLRLQVTMKQRMEYIFGNIASLPGQPCRVNTVLVPSSCWLELYWELHTLNSSLPYGDKLSVVLQSTNQSFIVCGSRVGIYKLIETKRILDGEGAATLHDIPSTIPLHISTFGNSIFHATVDDEKRWHTASHQNISATMSTRSLPSEIYIGVTYTLHPMCNTMCWPNSISLTTMIFGIFQENQCRTEKNDCFWPIRSRYGPSTVHLRLASNGKNCLTSLVKRTPSLATDKRLFLSQNIAYTSSCANNKGFIAHLSPDNIGEVRLQNALMHVCHLHLSLFVHVGTFYGPDHPSRQIGNDKTRLAQKIPIFQLVGRGSSSASSEYINFDHPAVVAACSEAIDAAKGHFFRIYLAGNHTVLFLVHHIVCDISSLMILAVQLFETHGSKSMHAVQKGFASPNASYESNSGQEVGLSHVFTKAGESFAMMSHKLDSWHNILLNEDRTFSLFSLDHDYKSEIAKQSTTTAHKKRPCGNIKVSISNEFAIALRKCSNMRERNVFATLASAWSVVLRRQGGYDTKDNLTDTLTFGSSIIYRDVKNPSKAHLVGCFSALLPTRCKFSSIGNGQFDNLADHIQLFCRAVFDHMDVPLMGIIDRFDTGSKIGGNPLFKTCFSFASYAQIRKAAVIDGVIFGMKTSLIRFYEASFDLWLGIGEMDANNMMGNLLYDASIFSRRSAAALLMSLKACLKQVVCKPDISLSAMDECIIKAGTDMNALSAGAASTFDANFAVESMCGSNNRYHDRSKLWQPWQFLESGIVTASSVSSVSDIGENITMSFETVHLQAIILASKFKRANVCGPQSRISLFSCNSWCALIVHFAASLVGGIVGNHNVHLSVSEFTYQLKLFDPELVIVGAGDRLEETCNAALERSLIEQNNGSTIFLRAPWSIEALFAMSINLGTNPGCTLDAVVDQKNHPYMLYFTSGTSGKPKGVVLNQTAISSHAVCTICEMRLNSHDIWLHVAPIFHLVDAFSVYAVTAVGGHHILQAVFEASTTLRVIEREGITVLNLASTMVALMCSQTTAENVHLDLSSLRMLSCGGSPVVNNVVLQAIGLLCSEFFVSYGMTECCGKICVSVLDSTARQNPNYQPNDHISAICTSGRPFRIQKVRIVEPNGKLVVPGNGRVGEVQCKGITLFSKYVKDCRTSDIFDSEWFRTGDIAMVDSNGYIFIVDRKTDVVLVGGENVYTVEVENTLQAHSAVQQAAVYGIDADVLGQVIHASVVLKPACIGGVQGQDLVNYVRGKLSSYKVPNKIHLLKSLPHGASGKVLKSELRKLALLERSGGQHHSADTTFESPKLGGTKQLFASQNSKKYLRRYLIILESNKDLLKLPNIVKFLSRKNVIKSLVVWIAPTADAKITTRNFCSSFLESNVDITLKLIDMRDIGQMAASCCSFWQLSTKSTKAIEMILKIYHGHRGKCVASDYYSDGILNIANSTSPIDGHHTRVVLNSVKARTIQPSMENGFCYFSCLVLCIISSLATKFAEGKHINSFGVTSEKKCDYFKLKPNKPMFLDIVSVQKKTCEVVKAIFGETELRKLPLETRLWDLGLTSTLALSLSSSLESEFNHNFPGSVAFNHESVDQLANFIYEEMNFAAPALDRFSVSRQAKGCSSDEHDFFASPKHSPDPTQPSNLPAALKTSTLRDGVYNNVIVFETVTIIISSAIHRCISGAADSAIDQQFSINECKHTSRAAVKSKFEGRIEDIINIDESFWSMGLTSVTAVQMSNRLSSGFQKDIPSTALFDNPSITKLSAYIITQMGYEEEDDGNGKSRLDMRSQLESNYLKRRLGISLNHMGRRRRVVSASHLTSGMAESFEGGFNAQLSHADCVINIPKHRWNPENSRVQRQDRQFGNILTTIDDFDSEFFKQLRAEAELVDPQQRLLLHRCTVPLTSVRLNDKKCGVFVAISHIDYALKLYSLQRPPSPYMATGSAHSVACGRISFTFGLTGPCTSIDTACSSALVACHFLHGCILHSECKHGIAAAVNMCLSQKRFLIFNAAGMLSKEGRCKTLDATADGYVRTESCCVLALINRTECKNKIPFKLAFCDALFVSSSVLNQDGLSSSLTAPNGPSQQALNKPDWFVKIQLAKTLFIKTSNIVNT